jgi:SAM-dependent methyltransferase
MQPQEYHTLAAMEEQHWWYRALHRRLLARLAREARRRGRPLRVFDAGCGTGGLLQILSRRADVAEAEGCDLHPLALSYARSRGVKVRWCSVNELQALPSGWDLVCSVDVLYHREVTPSHALAGMAALLAPGGVLLLNVAAMPCLARRHDVLVMGGRRFLPAGLRRHVEASGLAVEELRYWNVWLTPLLWLRVRLDTLGGAVSSPQEPAASDLRLPPPWLNHGLGVLLELERRLAPVLPQPWGSSLLLVARKPVSLDPL